MSFNFSKALSIEKKYNEWGCGHSNLHLKNQSICKLCSDVKKSQRWNAWKCMHHDLPNKGYGRCEQCFKKYVIKLQQQKELFENSLQQINQYIEKKFQVKEEIKQSMNWNRYNYLEYNYKRRQYV